MIESNADWIYIEVKFTISKYGKTKLLAENYIIKKLKKTKINFCIGRIFSIFDNHGKDFFLKSLIKKYNKKYSILKFSDFGSFELKASNLRSYYYKNILAFGDLLHNLHPLAGQGFNMSIRDIKVIFELIKFCNNLLASFSEGDQYFSNFLYQFLLGNILSGSIWFLK